MWMNLVLKVKVTRRGESDPLAYMIRSLIKYVIQTINSDEFLCCSFIEHFSRKRGAVSCFRCLSNVH